MNFVLRVSACDLHSASTQSQSAYYTGITTHLVCYQIVGNISMRLDQVSNPFIHARINPAFLPIMKS